MHNEISPTESAMMLTNLTMAAEAETLTEQQLSEAVRIHVHHLDEPFSVGLLWMRRNIKHLYNLPFDLATFLVDHLDVPDFGRSLIHSRGVLEVVPPLQRARVYHEAFVHHGDISSAWVRDALQLGVAQGVVAAMILKRLRQCTADSITDMRNFLHYGPGKIERANSFFDLVYQTGGNAEVERISSQFAMDESRLSEDMLMRRSLSSDDPWNFRFADTECTYWAALTDEQLEEAIEIVAEKAPNLLFELIDTSRNSDLWLKLSMRLGIETMQSLMEEAARKLTSLGGVSLKRLSQLSVATQLQVARNTGGSVELAVQLALAMSVGFGCEAVLTEFEPLFAGEGSVAAFRLMWTSLHKASDQLTARFIKRWLLEQVAANGYIYGQVRPGQYFDHKLGRKVSHLRVKHEAGGEHTYYVQDETQRNGFFPKRDDWVFIKPSTGKRIARLVVAAPFIPAHRMT